jgi:hypothetical protein
VAWRVLLAANVSVVVGSGDICRKHLSLTLDQARDLISTHGPVGRWLWEEFLAWYYRFVKPIRENDFSKPWIIWDDITLAFALGMTTQEVHPRPVLNDQGRFEHPQRDRTITWITGMDEKRMWADFVTKLDAYQRTHAVGQTEAQAFLP